MYLPEGPHFPYLDSDYSHKSQQKRKKKKEELPVDPRRKQIPVRNLGLVRFLAAWVLYFAFEFFKQ